MGTVARILADAVVVVHAGFVLFVVLGGLLVLRRRWVVWLHLPAAAWGALLEFLNWTCPLTPLENELRRLAGEAGFEGGFIEHHILPVLYPPGLAPDNQFLLGLLAVAVNVLIYGWVVWRWRRRAGKRP